MADNVNVTTTSEVTNYNALSSFSSISSGLSGFGTGLSGFGTGLSGFGTGLSGFGTGLSGFDTGFNSYNFSGMMESGFSEQHSFSDVFGAYNFGVSDYSASSYNISGYSNPYGSVRQQSYSSVNQSSSYATGTWFDVGDRNGYIENFTTGSGSGAGVLNFQNTNISSFRRESDFVNFHMADGTSFQMQNSSSENEVLQYSTNGTDVSYAKIGYADRDNSFVYEDGVTYYAGGEHEDVLNVTNYESRNIWLDGSRGVRYSNINNIDATESQGNNQLVGNRGDNEIYAGQGNDSLWGGSGDGDDVLYGGAGDNTYFYGRNNGNDTIVNSVSTDSVNLFNVSLRDIVSANEVGQDFVINMAGGQSLTIQGQNGASNFILSDKSSYNYNRETHRWSRNA